MSAGDWKEMYGAAASGNLELVQYHIKNGVNPNYQHPEIMSTALVASIIGGHSEISLFLLENGADPTLISEFDNLTPLQAAKMFKRQELVEILSKMIPKKSLWQKLSSIFKV
ncbi:ankyrin repeat domain-containing protein [Bdellovibrio sp. HCB185ZH]|uniref:ankyrin repeat domain-containing protein n=1 Tax=Bdellovibrio sp. HCB185ZH TaxID=3394235 RepID=UPI0039A45FCE